MNRLKFLKRVVLGLLAVFLAPIARVFAARAPIQKTFKIAPNFAPETQRDMLPTLTPGFSKEVGGDLFRAKFGESKFRYEYKDQWIEFEPLNHLLPISSSLSNRLEYPNYWTDTDLRFTVKEYGVKVEIVLTSDKAPTAYVFRYTKSEGWQDEWIKPPTAHSNSKDGMGDYEHVPVSAEWTEDTLTYSLPADISKYEFPLVLDPTFELGNSVDDTWAKFRDGGADTNEFDTGHVTFGKYDEGTLYKHNGFVRFALDIPIGSTITAAKFHVKSHNNFAGAITCPIKCLIYDNKLALAPTGFDTTYLAAGANLRNIAVGSVEVDWEPEAWVTDTWYESPDFTAVMQEAIDHADYDPDHAENKYVGFRIYECDEAAGATTLRQFYSYDDAAANAAELIVTYTTPGGGTAAQII